MNVTFDNCAQCEAIAHRRREGWTGVCAGHELRLDNDPMGQRGNYSIVGSRGGAMFDRTRPWCTRKDGRAKRFDSRTEMIAHLAECPIAPGDVSEAVAKAYVAECIPW